MAKNKRKRALAKLIEGLSAASKEAVKAASTRGGGGNSGPSGDLAGIKPQGSTAKGCGSCD